GSVGLCAQANGATTTDKNSASAQKQYDALVKEYDKARSDFSIAYSKATEKEREKLRYPQPDSYSARFLALAKENPQDAAAVDALVWIASNCRQGEDRETSLDLLLKDHLQSPKLGRVAQALIYSYPD